VLDFDLRQSDLLGLPAAIGKQPDVNPHVFTLTFGSHRTSLRLTAGAPLPEADPDNADAPEQRFAAIARMLQQTLQSKPRDE
jgi:hypothetical protein